MKSLMLFLLLMLIGYAHIGPPVGTPPGQSQWSLPRPSLKGMPTWLSTMRSQCVFQ